MNRTEEMRWLGDKKCYSCGSPKSVEWKSIGVFSKDNVTVEIGRYVCRRCNWTSELHECTFELIENGEKHD